MPLQNMLVYKHLQSISRHSSKKCYNVSIETQFVNTTYIGYNEMTNLTKTMVENSNVIILADANMEAVIFNCMEGDKEFLATGEESGEEYKISLDEVNVDTTIFYALKMLNPKDFGSDAEKRSIARSLFDAMLDEKGVDYVLSVLR